MNKPRSAEEALDYILTEGNRDPNRVPQTIAKVAAEGLATTQAGRQILEAHIKNDDLPKIHASIPNILADGKRPSDILREVGTVDIPVDRVRLF